MALLLWKCLYTLRDSPDLLLFGSLSEFLFETQSLYICVAGQKISAENAVSLSAWNAFFLFLWAAPTRVASLLEKIILDLAPAI